MNIFSLIRNNKDESQIINFIEKNNIDINTTDDDNYNMLMIALTRNLFQLSNYLIEKKIDLNHQNYKGLTALHVLAYNYDKEVLINLLDSSIDLSLQDEYGNAALWTTIMNDKGFGDRLEMIGLLLKYGADKNQLNNVNKSPFQIAKILGYPKIIKILEGEV